MAAQKFLFILTSHEKLGKTGQKTGFHYQELTDPYYILTDHNVQVDLASIDGGEPPADPGSLEDEPENNPPSVQRFLKDPEAMQKLKTTAKLRDIDIAGYEGIYLPGGHGTMWDLPDNKALIALLEEAWRRGKVLAAVCHGPAGFVNIRDENGAYIVKDRRVNCFTDNEERAVKKQDIVPFLLESKLRERGAIFECQDNFQAYVAEDGQLITGQNPPSTSLVGNAILRALGISPFEKTAVNQ